MKELILVEALRRGTGGAIAIYRPDDPRLALLSIIAMSVFQHHFKELERDEELVTLIRASREETELPGDVDHLVLTVSEGEGEHCQLKLHASNEKLAKEVEHLLDQITGPTQ